MLVGSVATGIISYFGTFYVSINLCWYPLMLVPTYVGTDIVQRLDILIPTYTSTH